MAAFSYRLIKAFDIKVIAMDGDWLLYHTGTGQSHRLTGIAADVFARFLNRENPVDFDSLMATVSSKLEADEMTRILESLSAIYVIESDGQFG